MGSLSQSSETESTMENKLQHTCATTREFTLQFLEHITNNFSEECIIGRGGYGVVYKGVIEDGEEIAVKKLHHMPGLDDKQFRNEFNNFIRAQHQNIVRLVGYCYYIGHRRIKHNGEYIFAHVEERLLCFEYLHGGSLDKHISDESCGLDWPSCYKIIKGVCEGLNHLHNGSKDPIYHLDLKPANILLDKDMMPKIGDFGLSRLFPSEHTYITTKILGTRGYMPPEYIDRYQITRKFDVFSLGVIIIQIMAGRHGYSEFADMPSQEFIELVHENWRKRLQAAMLSHTSHEVKTCIEIALRCVEADRVKRPTIAEIVDELNKLDTTIVDELNKLDTTIVDELNEFDTAKTSPMGQVSDLRSKQAFNQFASSGWRLLPLPEKLPVPAKSLGGKVRKTLLRWLLLLWVVGWLITCFWIFFSMNSLAVEDRRKSLAGICDERARMLQDQFNVSMNYLQNLAILISTFHHSQNPSALNQTTFARYAERTAFELPLTGLLYAVRVMHAEREQFERLQGWSISCNCNSCKKSPGPVREYAPVMFAQDAYKHFLSLDMLNASGDDERENILRARESGKGVLTAPCKLLNDCRGVISTYTVVYKSELPANARPQERNQAAIGYVHGILDIGALLDKLLHQLAGKQSIMVNVYDTTNERPISMYCSNDTGGGMYHNSTLNFGDPSRRHEMHCRFMQSPPWPWLAITLSLGTLVIALLTGHIFHATVHRIAKVEDDFQNMMELKKRA